MIFLNTILLIVDNSSSSSDYVYQFDFYFLLFYFLEMMIKICGLGFIINKNSYMRNGWNLLDLFIIMTGAFNLTYNSNDDLRFSVLRVFIVLRPLKTISSLKNLKKLIRTLINAAPMIMNEILIVLIWLIIYAKAGFHLLSGVLKKRCFDKQTGLIILQNFDNSYIGHLCGYATCPNPEINICGKFFSNPNMNITNFDSFLWSLLNMFQEITMESWSNTMFYCVRTFSYLIIPFFFSLSFFGSYILMNILVSIITKAYQEAESKNVAIVLNKKEKEEISFNEMNILKINEQENYRKIIRILNFEEIQEKTPARNIIKTKLSLLLQRLKNIVFSKCFPFLFKKEETQIQTKKKSEYQKKEEKKKSFLANQIQKLIKYRRNKKNETMIQNNVKIEKIKSNFEKKKKKLDFSKKKNVFESQSLNKFGEFDNVLSIEKNFLKLLIEENNKNNDIFITHIEKKPEIKKNSQSFFLDKTLPFAKNLITTEKHQKNIKISKILTKLLDYKLMVDHSQAYNPSSGCDIIPDDNEKLQKSKELKLNEEIKNFKGRTHYKLYKISSYYSKKYLKKNVKFLKLALKKQILCKNLNWLENDRKLYESSQNSPNKPPTPKRKKVEKLKSYRESYSYLRFKLQEDILNENLNKTENEQKFSNDKDYFEIKVF